MLRRGLGLAVLALLVGAAAGRAQAKAQQGQPGRRRSVVRGCGSRGGAGERNEQGRCVRRQPES